MKAEFHQCFVPCDLQGTWLFAGSFQFGECDFTTRIISLSGIPSKIGDTNFRHIPPIFLTACTSFCSICFSRILRSFFFNGVGRRHSFHKTLYKAFFVIKQP
jgi:hypothetical protein